MNTIEECAIKVGAAVPYFKGIFEILQVTPRIFFNLAKHIVKMCCEEKPDKTHLTAKDEPQKEWTMS